MNPWWKMGLAAAYTAFIITITWHAHGIYDRAQEAQRLKDEIEAHQKDQQAANDHAADLENDLAAQRHQNDILNQQKENALATGNPNDNCKLPADRLQILHSAIAGHPAR
jgi:phosphoglycolate phosphatase-like HAD superfamily hydrolase